MRKKINRSLKFETEVVCQLCRYKSDTTIQPHIRWQHKDYTCEKYMNEFDAEVVSEKFRNARKKDGGKGSTGRKQTEEEKNKRSKSNKKFWNENPDRVEEVSERMKENMKNGNHPFMREDVREASRERMIKRNKTNEQKEIVKKVMTGRKFDDEWKRKISEGHKGLTHTEETKKKISETKKQKISNREYKYVPGKIKGYYYSLKMNENFSYRSNLELKYYKVLDENKNIKKWSCETIIIPYTLNGKSHSYFPDVFIEDTKELVEINSRMIWYLNKQKKEAKAEAARKYCKERGWTYKIVYEDDLDVVYSVPDFIKNFDFPRE